MNNSNIKDAVIVLVAIITFIISLSIQYFCPILTGGDSIAAIIFYAFFQWIFIFLICAAIIGDYLDKKLDYGEEAKTNKNNLNEKVKIRTYASDFFDAVDKKDIMTMDKKSMEWNDEFPNDANAIISKAVVLSMSNGDPLIIKKVLNRAKNYKPLDKEWYDFYYSGIANILEDECDRIEKELYG